MRLRTCLLTLGLALACAAPAAAQPAACTKTWDGPLGPAQADWTTAASWAPDGVPTAADVACLGPGTNVAWTQPVTLVALRSEGRLFGSGSGGKLTLTSPTEPSTITEFAAAYGFDHAAPLTIGTLLWDGGFIAGTGTTTVTTDTHFRGDLSALYLSTGHTLVTRGTGRHDANMEVIGGAVWRNSAQLAMDNGSLSTSTVDGVRGLLVNEVGGSLTRGSAGTYAFSIDVPVENDGVISSPAGSSVATGSPLARFGIYEGASARSSGTFEGVLLAAAPATPLRLDHGAVVNRATLTGFVQMPTGGSLVATDIAPMGGRFGGDATLVLQGTIGPPPGYPSSYGAIADYDVPLAILASGATMTSTAALSVQARRFEVDGTLVLQSTGANQSVNFPLGATLENRGVVRLQSGAYLTGDATSYYNDNGTDEAGRFLNRGLLVKETASSFDFRPRLINDGVVQIDRGRLIVMRFEQTPDGVLRFDVGGTTPGTGFGALRAPTFRYQGRLEATLSPGFTPAAASRYQVIESTTAQRSGAFGSAGIAPFGLDESQNGGISFVSSAARASAARAAPPATEPAPLSTVPAPAALPLMLAIDDRATLRRGRALTVRTLANDRVPPGTRVRLVDRSSALRVALNARSGRLRITLARRPRTGRALRVRYRLVAADGRRSRVATVRVRLAR